MSEIPEDSWRHDPTQWRTFRDRVEDVGATAFDADVLGRFFDLYRFECAPSVRFDWDPHGWARCYIRCDDGEWFADAHGVNVTEAFVLARRRWVSSAEHSTSDEVDD